MPQKNILRHFLRCKFYVKMILILTKPTALFLSIILDELKSVPTK